jgi:hypothetical protein
MYFSGSLWRGSTPDHVPCSNLDFACSKKRDVAKQPVCLTYYTIEASFVDAQIFEEFFFFFGAQLANFRFNFSGNRDRLSAALGRDFL